MAFLTFRQSADTITDAQANTSTGHIVRGVPLTMFEIDANFKALNDEGESYRKKYGLGVGQEQTDVLSLQQAFNTNDANNIRNTGFYRVYNTANTPLASKSGSTVTAPNSVLIHAQSFATPTESEVTAMQLTCNNVNGVQSVYFRTKQGNSTWNNWQALATEANISSSNTQINQLIESCVKKSGDTITGALTILTPSTLTGNNTIDSTIAVKGSTPSSEDYTGFTVYDSKANNLNSTKLGYFGLYQTSQGGFSGILLSASNPVNINADVVTESKIGWLSVQTTDADGNIIYSYKPIMTAPEPFVTVNDLIGDSTLNQYTNLVATTGWVKNQIRTMSQANNSFGSTGGIITGDVAIEKELSVDQNVIVRNNIKAGGNIMSSKSFAAIIDKIKPNVPEASVGSAGNGFLVTDASVMSDTGNIADMQHAARFWGSVNDVGSMTASMEAVNWAKATTAAEVRVAKISITTSLDGSTVTTYAPTPPTGDNSTQIVTTEWANATIDTKITNALNVYESNHPWDMGVL